MTARGRFVTIEGGDGAGKSTQCALLADWLRGHGLDVVQTREPGGVPGAETIRNLLVEGDQSRWDPLSELLLLSAARHCHVTKLIAPALARGTWVICDRFVDSTMAYQGYAMGVGREVVSQVSQLAIGDVKVDRTIILDLPTNLARRRAETRADKLSRYEGMDETFHQTVRDAFVDIARREPTRCSLVDAQRPIAAVADNVKAALADLIPSDGRT